MPQSIKFAIAACLGVAISTPAMTQKSPEKIRISDASKNGAILMKVSSQPFDFALQFSKNGNSGFGSRVYIMKIKAGEQGDKFIARTLSPGRYRLDSVWQQGAWSLCLEQGTFEFNIAAGRIAYIGTFHTEAMLQTIQANAIIANRTSMSSGDFQLSRGADRPLVDGRTEADISIARKFADVIMGGSSAQIDLAPLNETSFATSGFGKAIKVCG
jgi:hypothetical protein